jgi:hypothetical protein
MIRFRAAIVLALLAAWPAAAQDIPAITLSPGQSITIRFDDGGRVGAPERGRAEWTRFDVAAARQLAAITPPEAPVPQAQPVGAPEGTEPDPIPPDEVRMRFFSIAGRHTMLVVENGRNQAIAYRARMIVRGQSRPTDVCIVLPHLPSYEHWPYEIDRIELTDFRFIPWIAGRAPTCQ